VTDDRTGWTRSSKVSGCQVGEVVSVKEACEGRHDLRVQSWPSRESVNSPFMHRMRRHGGEAVEEPQQPGIRKSWTIDELPVAIQRRVA
jgi:hypothetical protein